jgi:hypothetical protein
MYERSQAALRLPINSKHLANFYHLQYANNRNDSARPSQSLLGLGHMVQNQYIVNITLMAFASGTTGMIIELVFLNPCSIH